MRSGMQLKVTNKKKKRKEIVAVKVVTAAAKPNRLKS